MDFNIEFHEQSSWNIGAEEFSTTNTIVDSDEFALVGEYDHSKLVNRNIADQHSISAITGLQESLDTKQPKGNYLSFNAQDLSSEQQKQARDNILAEEKGTWVCLETLTTTEDMLTFERTAEPDGTPYNLRAIKVIVKTPPGQKSGVYDWRCFDYVGTNTGDYFINGLCACLSTESYTVDWHRATAVFVAKPQFGLYDCCSLYGGQGGVMAYCGPANGSSQTVSTDKTIKRFWFMIYDKKPLISGSEIKIWGVRG